MKDRFRQLFNLPDDLIAVHVIPADHAEDKDRGAALYELFADFHSDLHCELELAVDAFSSNFILCIDL